MARRRRKNIRVGIVGLGRGRAYARAAGPHVGMDVDALCETWKGRLKEFGKELKVATYTDYDRFLEHDMDAVILANFFHEHAPFAVKALDAGKHVMSEVSACFTPAQAVELIEAVERSGMIYMFAENCAYMRFSQEMRRLYRSGLIGEFKYGEGEYIHPFSPEGANRLAPGVSHWRNWLPATYYCTHSFGPIMFITGAWPTKVNGFVIEYDPDDTHYAGTTAHRNDPASMIAIRMDNGALVKLLQVRLPGHGWWARIHGREGPMENLRWGDIQMVRVYRPPFDKNEGEPEERVYLPDFPEHHQEATRTGHGDGDFFMNYHFVEAIRSGRQPLLDVYRGVAMSIVGILAYCSALNNSNTVEVPDLRKKSMRDLYRNDHWSPDPSRRAKGRPWPSVRGDIRPSRKALARARKVWKDMGHY